MEVGVWLIGVVLRALNALMAAASWVRARVWPAPRARRLPPPRNRLLLRSAADLAQAIRKGKLTSGEVVGAFIERVKEVNPYLNAVVDERFEEALQEANTLDQRLHEARWGGADRELLKDKPLYGLPFTVKESCSLAGEYRHYSSASESMVAMCDVGRSGSRAASDGAAVRRVRGAGAVPLLVSATPELCLGWETTSLLHGRTNNPYDLHCTPGGSSGGESALLASAASPLSVSSDIAGSIRIPAAFCGLFGHKPTPGIIPIEGHIPTLTDEMYPKFLTVGPICRHAEDLPLMLSVMAGDRKHLLNLQQPVDLANIKVHYMTEASTSVALLPVEPHIRDLILRAAKHLQDNCGATISEKKFKALEDSVEMSISVFFSMKDIPNLLHDPANPKRDKSLLVELVKSVFGMASRSLQALGFALISRTRLFIPRARTQHYQHLAHRLQLDIAVTHPSLLTSFTGPAPPRPAPPWPSPSSVAHNTTSTWRTACN
ncbi:fatty-acid amide hydrolase 2-A [Papilio machaon]|uniref:fatty-acid amide hydrolase 2-A n=1 Tax=Papilio machaon TaxID=76193 RepID=UPI001E6647F5|nr:fatty-acid amide hydrolase 2-A [Papilio machaon]